MQSLDPHKMPRHIAIIMDGNGRWARARMRNRIFGHEEGAKSVKEVAKCCLTMGISHLTLYSFSKENWQRPKSEVNALWNLLNRFLQSELNELMEKEIRVIHLGDREAIPSYVMKRLDETIATTALNQKLHLGLALNYGGRQEIVRAASLFARDVQEGKMQPADLTQETFSRYLFAPEFPDPDLVIRTGGEYRISNFLLWQVAYAEIYTTAVLWPDFRESQLEEALLDYQRRERRFGKTSAQVQGLMAE